MTKVQETYYIRVGKWAEDVKWVRKQEVEPMEIEGRECFYYENRFRSHVIVEAVTGRTIAHCHRPGEYGKKLCQQVAKAFLSAISRCGNLEKWIQEEINLWGISPRYKQPTP